MADKDKKSAKKAKEPKKKDSMRESAAKSRAKADKPKRVRKAATAASKPVSKAGKILTTDYHLVEPKDGGNFWTKSRRITPGYFRSAWRELKQVTWPGRKETWRLVLAVFIFAVILGAFIAALDFVFERLLRAIIF